MRKLLTSAVAALWMLASFSARAEYVGDYAVGSTVCHMFATFQPTTGAMFALASGAVDVYFDGDDTQEPDDDGITLTASVDSVAGKNRICIATSADGTFYAANRMIHATLSAGTVDGVSVAGAPVFSFSLAKAIANMTALSGDSAAADRLEAILDGTCGSYSELGVLRGNGCTAQSYTAGTPSLTLDSSAAFGDNALQNSVVMICGSTQGYCQSATIVSNTLADDIAVLDAALEIEATGTITFTIYGTPQTSTATTPPSVAQIVDGVWDRDATSNQDQGSFGQAIGDPVADANTIFKATVTDAFNATVGEDVVQSLNAIAALDTAVAAVPDATEVQTAAAAALDAEDGANFTLIPGEVLAMGACDSGSTTTCVDAGQAAVAADYWRGTSFKPLTGPVGQTRCVVAYDEVAEEFTFVPPLTAAITTNTFQIIRDTNCVGVNPAYTP